MNCFLRITLTLLSLLCAHFTFSQVDLTKGLVAYYPFNGNANDASGNGNDAIFNNATLTTDYFGNANSAYYFNGVDNYMEIANAPALNPQQLTLCALVKVEGFYDGPCYNNCIIDKGYNDGEYGNYSLRFTQSAITNTNCDIQDTLNQQFVGYSSFNPAAGLYYPRVTKDVWSCVVFTVDDSLKLYVNGNLVWKEVKQYEIGTNDLNVFLGKKNHPSYPFWFKGVMDEVRIYNRAIDAKEVEAYSVVCAESDECNNWLKVNEEISGVQIGDLDVAGDHITVEAEINRTTPYPVDYDGGDVVSKHDHPNDDNYLLRPTVAQITTTNGFFQTRKTCDIELNKTYHIALVYDGIYLRFYRNGFLLDSVPASGNLFQNDLITAIGTTANFSSPYPADFIGYINEVRIWNIARSQSDIRAYMNKPLPNPSSQQGLLAYYTFDNLKNKQGNSQWDGNLIGNAAINQTNPTCSNFTADSCEGCVQPVVTAGNDVSICSGDSTVLQASGATTYSWNFPQYLSNDSIANPIAYPPLTTRFIVTGFTDADCFATDTVNVVVNPLPQADAGNDVAICFGDTTQLHACCAITYNWTDSSTLTSGHINNPIAQPTSSTDYILTATNNFNCKASDTVRVTVLNLPPVYAGADESVCGNNNSAQLAATGAQTYIWSPATGLSNPFVYNPVASPTVTTKYVVTGTGSNGCINTDTLIVRAGTLPVFSLDPSMAVCKGSSVKLTATGGDYYKWSPVENIPVTDSSITVSPATSVTYSVVITDTACAITDSLFTNVTVNPLPDLRVFRSTDINCSNPTSQLYALSNTASYYSWSPDTLINDTSIYNPIAHPENDTWYRVDATTDKGCTTHDSVLVRVEPQVKGEGYLVPNAFTPNGDGLNDCFQVKYWVPVKDFDISIFDRWGYRVFHSTDVSSCWNGYTNNKEQAPGTYVYQIRAFSTCANKLIFVKGTVVLLK